MNAPYRMIAAVTMRGDDRGEAVWWPTGGELGPGRRPAVVPGTLVLEAAAQCAGLTLSGGVRRAEAAWMLAGIEAADVGGAEWGEPLLVEAHVIRRSAGTGAVAVAVAAADGGTVATGRLLMVRRRIGGVP